MAEHALVKEGVVLEYRDYDPLGDQSVLAAGKPRMLPVVEENAAFNSVTQTRDGPAIVVEAARVVRRYTVRAKSAGETAAMRQAKRERIKAEASDRVLAYMPDFKQRQALWWVIETLALEWTNPSGWPAGKKTTLAAIRAQWAEIKRLRDLSDAKEAEVAALADPVAINSYDPAAGW